MRFPLLVCSLLVLLATTGFTRQLRDTADARLLRTPWGDPDLQGVWNFAAGTPLERPEGFGRREFMSDDELARAERAVRQRNNADRRDGGAGADVNREANEFWYARRDTILSRRTSLIVDPPDGKLPPLTEDALRKRTANASYLQDHPADSWEDRNLRERCVIFLQHGPPIIPINGPNDELLLGFPFHFQVVQTRGYLIIRHEEVNVRIVPLDGRAHLPQSVSQWLGDSRGRWQDGTLVVETTNFREGRPYAGAVATAHLRVVERFTRVDAENIDYRFTVDDPTTWTKPWTASVPIARTHGQIYEYACHEGNYSLRNILTGARALESRR
jgi:hypothetical protein